ncbi:MAG: hypothetical protein JSS81_03585 [Acidobacteria bacterium]|nr:hypothetical protein [Acidobacteriota bacterium]
MLKTKLMQLLIVSAVVLTAGLMIRAQSGEQAVLAEAERISKDQFNFTVKTAKGAKVYGVKKPSPEMLDAIDRGLTDLFAVARKNKYKKRLKYSDYIVFIAKPDRQKNYDGEYSPDIAIGAAQYAGTIYDKGGYIYAAGMVIGYNPGAFIIGEHTKDFNRVADVVRFEGEHIVLYHNDRKRYNETADHSKGGGHPILQ